MTLAGGTTTTLSAHRHPTAPHQPPPAPTVAPPQAVRHGHLLDRSPARHRADDIHVRVRRLRGDNAGRIQLSPVDAPWYTTVAANPAQLRDALARCFVAVEERSYALWKRQRPDGAQHAPDTGSIPTQPRVPSDRAAKGWRADEWRSGGNKREQHPADWTPLPDGRWQAPRGRVHPADSDMVRKVIARRIALGLPIVPVDGTFDLSGGGVAEQVAAAAQAAGVTPHEWLAQAVAAALPDTRGVAS